VRQERRATGEFVYWGRVSLNDSDKYNCAADCLVLFHWGTDESNYTVHLWGEMRRELWRSPVP